MNSTSELCGGGWGRYVRGGEREILPVDFDPCQHCAKTIRRIPHQNCVGEDGGRYGGGGERDSLPVDFDPCQYCAKTL